MFEEGRLHMLKGRRVFAGVEVAPDRRQFHTAGGKATRFLLEEGLSKDQFQILWSNTPLVVRLKMEEIQALALWSPAKGWQ
eukprot:7887800-Pyramimonas_sp.AAC.1